MPRKITAVVVLMWNVRLIDRVPVIRMTKYSSSIRQSVTEMYPCGDQWNDMIAWQPDRQRMTAHAASTAWLWFDVKFHYMGRALLNIVSLIRLYYKQTGAATWHWQVYKNYTEANQLSLRALIPHHLRLFLELFIRCNCVCSEAKTQAIVPQTGTADGRLVAAASSLRSVNNLRQRLITFSILYATPRRLRFDWNTPPACSSVIQSGLFCRVIAHVTRRRGWADYRGNWPDITGTRVSVAFPSRRGIIGWRRKARTCFIMYSL